MKKIKNFMALFTMLMAGWTSALAQAPELVSFQYPEGSHLSLADLSSVRVELTEAVSTAYWSLIQDGETVASSSTQWITKNYFDITNIPGLICARLLDGTMHEGDFTLSITKVDYGTNLSAENLGSVDYSFDEHPSPRALYPAPTASVPVPDVKRTTSVQVTFPTSTQIKSIKTLISQNGHEVGYLDVPGKLVSTKYQSSISFKLGSCEIYDQIESGEFTFDIVEVTYMSLCYRDGDGNQIEKTYSEGGSPLISATFNKPADNAKIVSETGLESNLVLSWYPADATEGVKTFTFDKPMVASGISARLDYGYTDPYTADVPWTLSADGKTLTLDLRGTVHNIVSFTDGKPFVDNFGAEMPYPESITLVVEGLVCTDGSKLLYTAVPLAGSGFTVEGAIWKYYNYKDITFKPAIKGVEFYNSADPETTYKHINASTDMMSMTISEGAYIDNADVSLVSGKTAATVAYADLTRPDDNTLLVPVPASIKAAGSAKLVVGLRNVGYNFDDGTVHDIKDYDLSKIPLELFTVAELKDVEAGKRVSIISNDGIKVTLSNDEIGITFIEDETAGVWVMPSSSSSSTGLHQGQLLKGTVVGVTKDGGFFEYIADDSDVTVSSADVYEGLLITAADAIGAELSGRLVTLVSTDDIVIANSGSDLLVNDILVVTDLLAPTDEVPEEIENVTGVYYIDNGQPVLFVRNILDFNHEIELAVKASCIADLSGLDMGTEVILDLDAAKVTFSNPDYSMTFIEDATGAVMAIPGNMVNFLEAGKAITGTLKGMMGGAGLLLFYPGESDFTTEDTDISTGTEVDLDDLATAGCLYRLVTVKDSESTRLTTVDATIDVAGKAVFEDLLWALGDEYEMPSQAKQITGLVVNGYDELFDLESEKPVIVPRSTADIVEAAETGIEGVITDGNAMGDIYNVMGVKVLEAGKSADSLAPGIYISAGRKFIVR